MGDLVDLTQFPGAQEVLEAAYAGFALDPPQLAWEFANEHVVLSSEMAAEAGRYDIHRTPYLIELLTNLSSSSPVINTILMKGSQIGASQAGLAFLLYVIAIAGGPCLVVCPTTGMAELYSKQRLEPLIRNCEPAARKLPSNKGSESGNTILLKTFPGGILRLVGAGAVNPLKSMPAKVVVFEEPDEYERDLEGQGDATKIVLRRITTFGRRAKVFMNCTPGLQSRSIIYLAYLTGDQREYRMPCPHCGHLTVFNKDLFRFEKGRPETAHMVCESVECGKPILEGRHKTSMMAYGSGRWVPKVKDAPADMPRSYYLPAFYSPVGWENAYAWRTTTQTEMLAYRESYSHLGTIDVSATATLDPNESTNFIVKAAGNLTIAVAPPAAPPNLDPAAPTPQYLIGVKLWLYRPKGTVVTWQGVKWPVDVTDPAGDASKPSLLAAAAADGWDSYVLLIVPNVATFGYLAGRGYPA